VSGGPAFAQLVRQLFDAHYASLLRYLVRLSGDPEAAADIAQEAFVRLHERGSVPDDPRAWLATVANNLYRDDCRRTQRRAHLLAAGTHEIDRSPTLAPDAAAVRDEERALVRAALERLAPRDREMLLLRHEGFSYREIAQVVGVAETSVGTLLIRATAAFRTAFTEGSGASE
jgi:RNA polymerase sigma-70 factor (ECF subfamily)